MGGIGGLRGSRQERQPLARASGLRGCPRPLCRRTSAGRPLRRVGEEHRRRLRETYLSLLLGLARLHEDRADYNSAAEVLRRVVSEDPIREEAHAGLMRLYVLAGSKGEALAQYERLEEVLSSELGTEPSASSRALREEIAVGRFPPTDAHPFGYASEEPHVASKHNLPASRSSFVGREREMIEVKRALAMTRLLTLTGTGGSGKTRLALEVARELVGAYTDGAWLVELAPLSEGTLVAQAVATVLGVQEQPERPLTDTLVDFLRSKQALLVLDNCEHLVDTVARLADILLNSSPHLRVLATSRESLNVEGELTWLVPSLSAPSLGDAPTVEELAGYESVRLFVERARHRNPAFSLTSENAHAVAMICGRLDGIPLAIELAAARVGLSLEQIATRLDDSLKLLTAGSRTASPRQRTLRGTLDWSYTLLSAHEQMLFGRLSIFAGGWTLETAEVVGAEGDTEQRDILDFLSRLVEKSLVVAEATGGGGVRYRMLELIRQYAQEKLEKSGEAEEVRRRHASFFLTLAEEAEPALRLAGALMPFWEWHGHLSEGRRWLEEALEKEGRVSAAVRAKALYAVSDMAHLQFDTDRAVAAALEGIELIAEAEIDGSLAAAFRWMLGYAARLRGDYERAKELVEENLTFSQEADDKIGIANALIELGAIAFLLGDHERAKEHDEEGIVLCRELGYGEGLAVHLGNLAYLYLLEGDYERGSALNEEAAVLSRERGYKGGIAFALDFQGWVALLQGDHERARISYRESLNLSTELGDKMVALSSLD